MFGKIMRCRMSSWECVLHAADGFSAGRIQPLIRSNPRDAKMRLAKHIITWLHNAEAADKAESEFMRATHGGIPDEMPELKFRRASQTCTADGESRLGQLQQRRHPQDQRRCRENRRRKSDGLSEGISFDQPVVMQMGSRKFVRVIVS